MGHSCRTVSWDTLVGHSSGHSCGTLLWGTLVGHSCRTLVWNSLVEHSCPTLLWNTLVDKKTGHCCALLRDTFVGHFCKTLAGLWRTLVLLDTNSRFKSAKRAFRARLPPKFMRHVAKTSPSYETSSKSHMSKSPKRAFCTRLPPKVKRQAPSEHTHQAALPSSFTIPSPPSNTR